MIRLEILFDFCSTNKKNVSSQALQFLALVLPSSPALSFPSEEAGADPESSELGEEAAAQPPEDKASPTSLQRKSARTSQRHPAPLRALPARGA